MCPESINTLDLKECRCPEPLTGRGQGSVLQQLRRSLHPGALLWLGFPSLRPRDGVFTFRTPPTFKLNQISASLYVLIVPTLGKSSNLRILPTIPPLGMSANFVLATYILKNCFLDLRCTELVTHHPDPSHRVTCICLAPSPDLFCRMFQNIIARQQRLVLVSCAPRWSKNFLHGCLYPHNHPRPSPPHLNWIVRVTVKSSRIL